MGNVNGHLPWIAIHKWTRQVNSSRRKISRPLHVTKTLPTSTMSSPGIVLILGAGPRIGAAITERFSSIAYKVALASRTGAHQNRLLKSAFALSFLFLFSFPTPSSSHSTPVSETRPLVPDTPYVLFTRSRFLGPPSTTPSSHDQPQRLLDMQGPTEEMR